MANVSNKRDDWLALLPIACCGRNVATHVQEEISKAEGVDDVALGQMLDSIVIHLVVVDICEVVLKIPPIYGIALLSATLNSVDLQPPPKKIAAILKQYHYSKTDVQYFAETILHNLNLFNTVV